MNRKQKRVNRTAWLLFAFSSLCGLLDIIHITVVLCIDVTPDPMKNEYYLPGQGLIGGLFGLISAIISLAAVRIGKMSYVLTPSLILVNMFTKDLFFRVFPFSVKGVHEWLKILTRLRFTECFDIKMKIIGRLIKELLLIECRWVSFYASEHVHYYFIIIVWEFGKTFPNIFLFVGKKRCEISR